MISVMLKGFRQFVRLKHEFEEHLLVSVEKNWYCIPQYGDGMDKDTQVGTNITWFFRRDVLKTILNQTIRIPEAVFLKGIAEIRIMGLAVKKDMFLDFNAELFGVDAKTLW